MTGTGRVNVKERANYVPNHPITINPWAGTDVALRRQFSRSTLPTYTTHGDTGPTNDHENIRKKQRVKCERNSE